MSNFYCHLLIDIVDVLIICVFSQGKFFYGFLSFSIFIRFSNFLLESIKPAVKMDELGGTVDDSDEEMMEQETV